MAVRPEPTQELPSVSPVRRNPARPRPVPTRRLVLALAPAAALAGLAAVVPVAVFLWQAWLLLLVFFVVMDLVRPVQVRQIEVSRRWPRTMVVARRTNYTLCVQNRASQARGVWIRDVLPPAFEASDAMESMVLAAGESRELLRPVLPLERGRFAVMPSAVRVSRPFGLVARQAIPGDLESISVLPGRPDHETGVLLQRVDALEQIVGTRPVKRRGEDWEFDALRDYVVGDDIRFMDWKATARRRRATVRQFRLERDAEVVLALDSGRLMGSLVRGVRKFDLAMTPVLDLAATALRRGDRVGLCIFDSRMRAAIPACSGLTHLNLMRRALADVEIAFEPTLYLRLIQHLDARHRKRALVVIFTDFTDDLSSVDMVAALSTLARRHVLLFVAVNDPNLEDVLSEPPRQSRTVYQKAVAAELVEERARVLARLVRAGALVVEAEPAGLTARVLNRYLEGVRRL